MTRQFSLYNSITSFCFSSSTESCLVGSLISSLPFVEVKAIVLISVKKVKIITQYQLTCDQPRTLLIWNMKRYRCNTNHSCIFSGFFRCYQNIAICFRINYNIAFSRKIASSYVNLKINKTANILELWSPSDTVRLWGLNWFLLPPTGDFIFDKKKIIAAPIIGGTPAK